MKLSMFLISLVTIFVFSSNLFGQYKSITKEEFESAKDTAESNTYKKARTETEIETNYSGGNVTSTTNYIKQFLPPKQSKSLIVIKKGNTIEKTEEVLIGNTLYKKENDGKWIKSNLKNLRGEGYSGIATSISESVSEYMLEETKDGKETFQHYKVSTVSQVGVLTAYNESEYWIKDGLVHKTVLITSVNKRDNVLYKSIGDYEYNPKNLKIEAPIK